MILADEAATLALGARIAGVLRAGDVVALSGPLGSGKTTLARGCLAGLGYAGEVASPTFTVVQFYDATASRVPVLHVDLYRLDGADEAEELGLDDALADHALLVEWPERLGATLWPQSLRLALQPTPDGARCLTADVPEAWTDRWPPVPQPS
ncbi:MAG TPA: tRNA (adenosine(37)-N6)-threonylcarbamoyltransferase complex ATPase subunit type 1 TsaE [Sphingomonadaceae bacterium]|nr:tRNA (adenosine(37)-N6)-threonylcarbamoyltransferase complex ATPase subunit type 1 TsaE [Sphingomonadaceae bacterium]